MASGGYAARPANVRDPNGNGPFDCHGILAKYCSSGAASTPGSGQGKAAVQILRLGSGRFWCRA